MKKYLEITFIKNNTDLDDKILEIESILDNYNNIDYEINDDEKNIVISILYKDKDINTLKDISEFGKLFKDFGIQNNLFSNNEKYLEAFILKDIIAESDKAQNNIDVNKLIVKVPDNDEKVLDVLKQLNKIKKS